MVVAQDRPLFVGRESERELLLDLVRDAERGRGGVVLIQGEAGIGKTTLVAEVVREVHRRGLTLLQGSASERQAGRPFGVFIEALDLGSESDDAERTDIGRHLQGVAPEPHDSALAAPADFRFGVAERIAGLVERSAIAGPTVLVLEDMHWSDPASYIALDALVRVAPDLSLVVVVTARREPRRSELEQLADDLSEGGSASLSLGPLDPAAISRLVEDLMPTPSAAVSAQVERAGGNPLLITELVAALSEEDAPEPADVDRGATHEDVPRSLSDSVLRRLRPLGDHTLGILRLAALIDTHFSVDELGAVLQRPATDLVAELLPAIRAGIVAAEGPSLSFRHDLVRDVIEADTPEAVRRALHRQVAVALAALGRPAPRVAAHFSLGASIGDDEAIDWLDRAASETVTRQPDVAVDLLTRALEICDPAVDRSVQLRTSLVKACWLAGRLTEAEQLARSLLARPLPPDLRVSARRGLASALQARGLAAEADVEFQLLADDLGSDTQARDLALALAVFNRVWAGGDDVYGPAALVLDEAERSGNAPAAFWATLALANIARGEGRLSDGADMAGRCAAFIRPAMDQGYGELAPPVSHLVVADRLSEAEGLLRAWPGEEAGMPIRLMRHLMLSAIGFWSDKWDDAFAAAETASALAAEHANESIAVNAQVLLAEAAFHRGTFAGRTLPADDFGIPAPEEALLRALELEAEGNQRALLQLINATRARFPSLEDVLYDIRSSGTAWVRLLLAAEDRDGATAITLCLENIAAKAGVPSFSGVALHCRGLLDCDESALIAAVETLRPTPRALLLAEACEAAGSALARSGRLPVGVALIEEAVEAYVRLGAARDLARVDQVLRGLGIRRTSGPRRSRTATGWESLTETELNVARLVKEGLTYRKIGAELFISRRTVETHVAHMFTKLGLNTRVELAQLARRQAPGHEPEG